APASASSATVSATPPGSSGKQRSLSTLSGSEVAAASAATWATSSSRVTVWSTLPIDQANPALVVASASKPHEASSRAEPMSHGLGITNSCSRACSARKLARRSPTDMLLPLRSSEPGRLSMTASRHCLLGNLETLKLDGVDDQVDGADSSARAGQA